MRANIREHIIIGKQDEGNKRRQTTLLLLLLQLFLTQQATEG